MDATCITVTTHKASVARTTDPLLAIIQRVAHDTLHRDPKICSGKKPKTQWQTLRPPAAPVGQFPQSSTLDSPKNMALMYLAPYLVPPATDTQNEPPVITSVFMRVISDSDSRFEQTSRTTDVCNYLEQAPSIALLSS